MNNDLKINMKLISNNKIDMKLEDNQKINANMSGGIIEVDPIFTNSAAYTITFEDINIWNHKSNFSGSYDDLTNKPIIPTRVSQLTNDIGYITKNVNNLTNYTLTSNLSNVALSGEYSDLLNTPSIPSSTSDLDNDSGFITKDVNDLTNYTLSTDLSIVATTGEYSDLINTPSLATVATTGFYSDLINKPTLSTVASTGSYDDLIDKPTIPTLTSQLTNDSGYITNANIPTKTSDLTNDSGFITLSDIPTIPTKTSELTNDSGFITKDVNDLTNYTLTSNLASVATSGSYNDLSNKPTIPTVDSSVSTSSTNAVENKAITLYALGLNTYSTTEQLVGKFLNKNLYERVIYITSLPNNTLGFYDIFLSSEINNIDKCYLDEGNSFMVSVAAGNTEVDPMNWIYSTSGFVMTCVRNKQIRIKTTDDKSGTYAYVAIRYTKISE